MENTQIKIFEEKKVRTIWDAEKEEWYFSVVDVVAVLTESVDFLTARKYWNKLKQRLKGEGNETVTNCHQLKLPAADGKKRLTDVATTEQLFRLIQSIPSPKAAAHKGRHVDGQSASYPARLPQATRCRLHSRRPG